mmetsp:Transcript_16112/g.20436  ORF Transcript_16112/g.20436 Transcript_16112/m.20436 type:complete len:91 (-) Transcript_16112:230-502(-)
MMIRSSSQRLNFLLQQQHRPNRNFLRNASTSTSKTRGGAGFFQRLSSFIVGAGVSALASQYFIYKELVDGNAVILKKQKDMEKRLGALEK